MGALLVVFTLCGEPVFMVAHDERTVVAEYHHRLPQKVLDRLYDLALTEGSIISERSLEELTGALVQCS